MHGDTAIVTFEPVAAALDYRIYPLPDPATIAIGAQGDLSIRNAIYRCAGDRPLVSRENDQSRSSGASLAGDVAGYKRTEAEAVLGYVYLTPGPGRQPVYRISNPTLRGGYAWDWVAPPSGEFDGAYHVVASDVHARLIAQGWRDDGIVFYAPDSGTQSVYRRDYDQGKYGKWTIYYTDGPEHDARAKDMPPEVTQDFRPLAAPADGAVALHRVWYAWANNHDVLAAGEPRYQRALHQGNQPIWSLTWPGLPATTTLVIEALDIGCPFPGGYVGAAHVASTGSNNAPTITLDEARLPSGEVFINGQHDPKNRPRPVARAYVEATPEAQPNWDWFEGFNADTWQPAPLIAMGNNGIFIYRNSRFSAEFAGCTTNNTFGPLLGQLVLGGGDSGSSCNMHVAARGVNPVLAADRFLHVRMATDVPSTNRRYPQLMITTVKVMDIPTGPYRLDDIPVGARLGPVSFQHLPPGNDQSLIVQPFGTSPELQIEFCDRQGWGVSVQCPRANLYGFHVGDYVSTWDSPWTPVPVLGDLSGFDRPVRFDVYASTQRVYVFLDNQPAGCAVLPTGRMPAAPVTVLFGSVGYHMDIDEGVAPPTAAHQYLRTYSQNHIDRHMDDFGIELSVAAPTWDETTLPCGTRWYGGQ
jgi:hypothetical protein